MVGVKENILMDYILEEMNKFNADGVDFVPILSLELIPPVIASYTKEEWINGVRYYPKSGRKYWKMVGGKKSYV